MSTVQLPLERRKYEIWEQKPKPTPDVFTSNGNFALVRVSPEIRIVDIFQTREAAEHFLNAFLTIDLDGVAD